MINPVAELLSIPQHRVFANKIFFDGSGQYAGFDPSEPTSRDGGKRAVVQHLMDVHGFQNVVMFGDGATDLQARPPASAVIGYGGVVVRDVVRDSADWYIYDFQVFKRFRL
jgi:phosphoserine phosphatase